MKSKPVRLTWALFCLTIFTSSCGYIPLVRVPTKASVPESPKVQPNTSTLDSLSEKDGISVDCAKLLKQEKFDKLEDLAFTAQIKRERLHGGYWKLDAIVQGLTEPNLGQNASDDEWQAHIKRLEKWKKLMPDSVTARVALAESWVGFGYNARGEGYADTVSKENWRLFDERTRNGYAELIKSQDIGKQWPEWYVAMLQVGRAQGWDRKKYDQVFEAGFKIEPTYYLLQREMLIYLLPQYFGQRGDIAKFIESNSSRVAGDEGNINYFILFTAMQHRYGHYLNTEVQLSWSRVQQGYETLSRLYGVDRYRKNQYAWLAFYGCIPSDMMTGKKMMDEIGDDWDPEVWESKQEFDQQKNFLAKHPEYIRPNITTDPSLGPKPLPQS